MDPVTGALYKVPLLFFTIIKGHTHTHILHTVKANL